MKITNINLAYNSSYKIFSQMWEPENPPKGVIVLVHGLGEHSGSVLRLFFRTVLRGE